MAATQNAIRVSSHSWEYGATSIALIEAYNKTLSVYSPQAFPGGRLPNVDPKYVPALQYLAPKLLLTGNTLANGEGALADPASLGVGCLLLGVRNATIRAACDRQLKHLLAGPRFYNGAISHREDVAELWADGMFMIPPFLAYYAVATNDQNLLREAVRQCGLYRQVLKANTTNSWNGLWTHIVGPQSQTLGVWNTGNGWAALGMVRVLATVKNWSVSSSWTTEQRALSGWLNEIFAGLKNTRTDVKTGLWRNYLVGGAYNQWDRSVAWFGDAAGTAALVAAGLRFAVLNRNSAPTIVKTVMPLRQAVMNNLNDTTWLTSTVNPLDWFTTQIYTAGSPEAQAFVAMMGNAWRECVAANVCPA